MAQIIINNNLTFDEINEHRLLSDFQLSHNERISTAFKLMRLALLFSQKDKALFKKGIIIKQ